MNLINKIHNYELIQDGNFTGEETIDDLVELFNNIPKGDLKEIVISYDNYNYRGTLRVSGRGNDLVLKGTYERLLDDGYGSFSSTKLDENIMIGNTVSECVNEFLFWFSSLASNNTNKTDFDRYVF